MFASRAPGVYYQRLDAVRPTSAGVRTDIAAFAGLAPRGPIATPVAVESWRQFEAHFGGFLAGAHLPCTVRAFFENGGRRCWVVRVASVAEAAPARIALRDADDFTWRIAASSPGTWGDELEVGLLRRSSATATADPVHWRAEHATVSSTSGFVRGALVRAAQPGLVAYRIVVAVDAEHRRLYWVAPDASIALPGERAMPRGAVDRLWALESLEYDLLTWHRGRLVERSAGLSPSRHHPRAAVASVRSPDQPPPLVIVEDVSEWTPADVDARDAVGEARLALRAGRDGLATLDAGGFIDAIAALEPIGEISMIAAPDVHVQPVPPPEIAPPDPPPDPCAPCPVPPTLPPRLHAIPGQPRALSLGEIVRVYAELVDLCERRADCIALIDPPHSAAHAPDGAARELRAFRSLFDSDYAALFAPWVRIVDPLRPRTLRSVPPSGHVAGQTARTDLEIGVHRAAANLVLEWAPALSATIDDEIHGLLNRDGINVLRAAPLRGVRTQGARTMSSDPSWRYLPVRRTLIAIRESIEVLLQWAVFEPNDHATRHKVTAVIDAYLRGQWRKGALAGAQREAAYFIDASGTPEDRDLGRMIVRVGVAPTIPFEFVLLRVGRVDDVLTVAEDARESA
jgi:phage tail sheath protein FI